MRLTPEGYLVRTIRDGCAALGFPCLRLESGHKEPRERGRGAPVGTPDLAILLRNGTTLWVECKSPTGRLRPAQRRFCAICEKHGTPYVLARRWEDVEVWLR